KATTKPGRQFSSGREALATRPVSGRDDASNLAAPAWSALWSPQTATPPCEAHPGRRREGAEGSGQFRLERTVLTKAQEGARGPLDITQQFDPIQTDWRMRRKPSMEPPNSPRLRPPRLSLGRSRQSAALKR